MLFLTNNKYNAISLHNLDREWIVIVHKKCYKITLQYFYMFDIIFN